MTAAHNISGDFLGQGVALAHADPRLASIDAHPEELRYVQQAVESRKREFHAGRACARLAMGLLGEPPVAIPAASDRSPVWPPHLIGSISHCATFCLAVVARKGENYAAIGVDVEPAEDLPFELLDAICSPREMAALDENPPEHRLLWARILFSAKEAVYKCQYPLTGTMLDFQDLEVTLADTCFQAKLQRQAGMFGKGSILEGQITFAHGCIVTGVTVPLAALGSLAA